MTWLKTPYGRGAAILWAMAAGGSAWAQVPPSQVTLPRYIDPAFTEDRFEPPAKAVTNLDAYIPAAFAPELPPPNADKIRFALKRLETRGSSVYSADELARLTDPVSTGRTISLKELYDVAAAIRKKYEGDGYLLTRVVLGRQDLKDGTAEIDIEEFSVRSVLVLLDGKPWTPPAALDAILAEIKAVKPLSVAADHAAMLKMEALPGVKLVHARMPLAGEPKVDSVLEFHTEAATGGGLEILPRRDGGQTPPDGERSFVLRDVVVEGSSVFTADQLRPAYQTLLGRSITVDELYQVTKGIAARYEADGYILTEVEVPGQTVLDGRVVVTIREFAVDDVKVFVDGVESPPDSMERRIVDRIKAVRPLTVAAFQRSTLLLADLPGITVTSMGRSATIPNGGEVHLTRKTFSGGAALTNSGTPVAGIMMLALDATENGLLGLNESITVNHAHPLTDPGEVYASGISAELPVGADGTRLQTSLSISDAKPGADLRWLAIRSLGTTFSFGGTHPLIRSPEENLRVGLRVTSFNSSTTLFDKQTVSGKDAVRAVRGGANYDFADGVLGGLGAVTRFGADFHHGLWIFNARSGKDPYTSRPNADPTFQKVTFSADRTQQLGGPFALLLAGTGQHAFTPLPSAEMFGFGGDPFGRGFDGSEIAGDHGVAGKAELQYNQMVGLPVLSGFQAFAFYDIGRIWNTDGRNLGENNTSSGASAGIGVRAMLTSWLSGQAMVAKPVTRALARKTAEGDGYDPRFLFALSARF